MVSITVLAILAVVALVGSVVTLAFLLYAGTRQKKQLAAAQKGDAAPRESSRVARVAVVWPEAEQPLAWFVNGQRYAGPDEVQELAHREAVEEFVHRLSNALPQLAEAAGALPPAERPVAPLATDEGSRQVETATPSRAASARPAAAPLPRSGSPRPRSYEEEMEQPFFERLKSSFFTPSTPPTSKAARTLDKLEQPAIPQLDELDDLLQMRLAQLSGVPAASIRAGSNGMLEIVVEGQVYEHIDDVPHEAVRAAMQDAVRAWEGGIV